MTKVPEVVDRTVRRLPLPSSNGGPPPSRRSATPLAVVAAAVFIGMLLARFIDWRSHAHPTG